MLSTERFSNQNSFDEELHCDNLELSCFDIILSYVDIFQDSRPQWPMLRYVDLDVLCWYLFLSKTSRRVVVMKLKVNNLPSLKEIQRQIINFGKPLKMMWHGWDAKPRQHALFI